MILIQKTLDKCHNSFCFYIYSIILVPHWNFILINLSFGLNFIYLLLIIKKCSSLLPSNPWSTRKTYQKFCALHPKNLGEKSEGDGGRRRRPAAAFPSSWLAQSSPSVQVTWPPLLANESAFSCMAEAWTHVFSAVTAWPFFRKGCANAIIGHKKRELEDDIY